MAPGSDAFRSRVDPGGKPAASYESYFVEAASPDGSRAIWIRYTTHRERGGARRGTLWFTDFRHGEVRAAQQRDLPVEALDGGGLRFGPGTQIDPSGAVGALHAEEVDASWSLDFSGDAAPLEHLGKPRLYELPVPKTKLTSPIPDATISGTVQTFDEELGVDGWRGAVGHNWGAQHADRWLWLHGSGFDGDPTAWVDLGLARVRIGPVLTPWLAVGAWSIGGKRTMVWRRVRPAIARSGGIRLDLPGLGQGCSAIGPGAGRCHRHLGLRRSPGRRPHGAQLLARLARSDPRRRFAAPVDQDRCARARADRGLSRRRSREASIGPAGTPERQIPFGVSVDERSRRWSCPTRR
jgi:hypothetical protein